MKEAYRDARGLRWTDDLIHDVRYAARGLRRSPMFTSAAVLSLSLGIGANTAIFNLIDSVLIRTLPVERPDELVLLAASAEGVPPGYRFSFNMFEALRQQGSAAVDIAASASLRVSVERNGEAYANAAAQMVSGNYFGMLGVRPAAGRLLLPTDDRPPDGGAVAVVGHGYWQRQFGGDPGVVGTVVRLNGEPFTVVGVAPPEFFGTRVGQEVDFTMPVSTQPRVDAQFGMSLIAGVGADDFWLELIGRLRPGVSAAEAQPQLDVVFQRTRPLTPQRAEPAGPPRPPRSLALEAGSRGLSALRERFSTPLLVLMAVVAAVLLIACANVAHLLLARAANRRGEFALRTALGAGRVRLIRQLLAEGLLLAMLGGACGLLLAVVSRLSLARLLVEGDAGALPLPITLSVLGFTLGLSVLTVILFGLVPAFSVSRVPTFSSLREASRQGQSASLRSGVRSALVITQVALSVVLLIGAGLFVRTLINLRQVDVGFEQEHVLVARLEPRGSNQKRDNEPRLRQMYGDLLARVRALPGVRSASLSGMTPLGSDSPVMPQISVPGHLPAAGDDMSVRMTQIYPGYFSALGVPLLAGRDLSAADDRADAPPVAVINAEMARRFFATPADAVSRRFVTARGQAFEIVGVAANAHDSSLRDPVGAVAFSTYAHTPTGRGQMTLFVRTASDPAALVSTIRGLVREMDPAMPLPVIDTVAERVDAATRQEALVALLSIVFGGLALALAVVGLYGLMSYTVSRRQEEFGLRVALGASPAGLKRLVIRDSLVLVAMGLVIGVAAAAASVDRISGMLFALEPLDPMAFLVAPAILLAGAAIAAYIPARRVTRLDPAAALRSE